VDFLPQFLEAFDCFLAATEEQYVRRESHIQITDGKDFPATLLHASSMLRVLNSWCQQPDP
jgi:hypothetical protein